MGTTLLRLAGVYSFNRGSEEVANRYADLLVEVNDAIKSVDSSKHKVKKSKEKTMPGRMLFDPRSLNKAFKMAFIAREWAPIRVQCEYPTSYYVDDYTRPLGAPRRVPGDGFREAQAWR